MTASHEHQWQHRCQKLRRDKSRHTCTLPPRLTSPLLRRDRLRSSVTIGDADVDEIEAEIADAGEQAVQLCLVGNWARENCLRTQLERTLALERRAQNPPHGTPHPYFHLCHSRKCAVRQGERASPSPFHPAGLMIVHPARYDRDDGTMTGHEALQHQEETVIDTIYRVVRSATLSLLILGPLAACGDDASKDGHVPVVATFEVAGSERYKIELGTPELIDHAKRLLAGESISAIPLGTVVRDEPGVNGPWSWHIDPATLEFAFATTEVCDGLPSHVEDRTVTSDSYCPWSAKVVEIDGLGDSPLTASPTTSVGA